MAWRIVTTPQVKNLFGGIAGIAALGKNDLWAVGTADILERAVSEHFSCSR